jgi:tetratricopeptide (TPR) repeat protein
VARQLLRGISRACKNALAAAPKLLQAGGTGDALSNTVDESTGPKGAGGAEAPLRDELLPGTQLDHFVIRRKLGQGGMGVVYEADDHNLHRKAAIKVMRHEDAGDKGLRLIDEATKQGKLTGANVVTVYTAGRYRDQVFIAMEYMAGGTLADWLKKPRTVPQITKMFLAAGEGLAAAHAAGLVHRDFKPENVLLDADGEPHVADFGLADAAEDGTVKGRVAGTHGYMAPEQEKGDVAIDHRADQYAFSVSLYAALYKEMPSRETDAPRPLRPQSTSFLLAVPMWLRRVVLKGLSKNPADRYPNMKALLADLANDPARKRRQRILTTVTSISVAALLGLSGWLSTRETPEERARRQCNEGVAQAADAVWNPERQTKAGAAFGAADAHLFEQVNARLAAGVKGWTEASKEACLLPPSTPDRRRFQACLAERRKRLDSMGELFASADRAIIDNAIDIVTLEVEPAASCRPNAQTVMPSPAALVGDDHMRSELARARVLRAAHKYKSAAIEALKVSNEAADADALEVKAEADLAVGETYADEGRDGAREYLRKAIVAAEGQGNDELRARAWIALVSWSAPDISKLDEAKFGDEVAPAILVKLGRPALLEAARLTAHARIKLMEHSVDEAQASLEEALKLRRAHLPEDHPLVMRALQNWAVLLPPDRAIPLLEGLVATRKKVYGPTHAETADAITSLAKAQKKLARCDVALRLFDEALNASLERVDDDPIRAGRAHVEVATADECLAHLPEAQTHCREGLKLLQRGGASEDEAQRVEDYCDSIDEHLEATGPSGGGSRR